MRDGQLENWKHYLRDNPRRYMMRHEFPDLFQRALCVTIDGVRYSAFGNMLLLRQPEKHQVFFHRRTDGVPTEDTELWQNESRRLMAAAKSGDVLVTPGISECEKRIKKMALEQGLRLIHVQADKSYTGVLNVRLTPAIHRQIAMLALQEGISINAFIKDALEEKVEEAVAV